jgi:aminopeptidase-like protein
MQELIRRLYPICRSITGDGVRMSLALIDEVLPLAVHEVASGTRVLDWSVPPEWNIRDAWIRDMKGHKVVDFQASNLHVVNYSTPIRRRISMEELEGHLHSMPDRPDWIPYRTSYYAENWGFCLTHKQLEGMQDAEYEIFIDSTLEPGALTYAEHVVPGESNDELLISAHVCHPSLANDNLSGIAVAVELAKRLAEAPLRHSVRFLFAPGTIGAITWLARNRRQVTKIRGGLTLVCLGDEHPLTYKRTVFGDAEVDRAASHALAAAGVRHGVVDFSPYGYDERQYNAPGFRVPMGSLMRGRHGEFAEYHSSADDLDFVSDAQLEESVEAALSILRTLDANRTYKNLAPYGEPQLGSRGIYRAMGGDSDPAELQLAMLWLLNLSDGDHDLLTIAERAGIALETLTAAADLLARHDLLEEIQKGMD